MKELQNSEFHEEEHARQEIERQQMYEQDPTIQVGRLVQGNPDTDEVEGYHFDKG